MKIFNRKHDENPYHGLRQQILDIQQTQAMVGVLEGHPVFAAVVDMDMGDAIVSLASIADGTTSLYFSNGGGQLGLGQADKNIRTAALAFLRSADQILSTMPKTAEYPLPQNGAHIVYLKTSNGIYKQEINIKTINTAPKEIRFLNFLYQNILTKIGEYNQGKK